MSEGQKENSESAEWHVGIEGRRRGPFSLEEVRQMIGEGRLPANALTWKPGMPDWLPWGEVPELRGAGAPSPPAIPGYSPGLGFLDFLVFRRMVTPIMIQLVFWLGVLVCVLFGLSILGYAVIADSIGGALFGLLTFVFGPLLVRIFCELNIVFFRMNETLTDIKNRLEQR